MQRTSKCLAMCAAKRTMNMLLTLSDAGMQVLHELEVC